MRRIVIALLTVGLVASACASGPSPAALERNERPTTTTTTEPPPEGVILVRFENGRFRPAILTVDLDEFWIVEWRNEDIDDLQINTRGGEFTSPVIPPGDTWQVDFSTMEPALYRYNATIGLARIPGTVDTRPEQ
ncbi:MAG: hypothetical protein HKN07_02690 [Acidimicrobiia bacterium]|nr:hypothetical protein [Acidimicrobiia bacterium]